MRSEKLRLENLLRFTCSKRLTTKQMINVFSFNKVLRIYIYINRNNHQNSYVRMKWNCEIRVYL